MAVCGVLADFPNKHAASSGMCKNCTYHFAGGFIWLFFGADVFRTCGNLGAIWGIVGWVVQVAYIQVVWNSPIYCQRTSTLIKILKPMFPAHTVAQMAAFFIAAESNVRISVLKLVKLMYLADRESMRLYGHPISLDDVLAMRYGPVLSGTLNFINGMMGDEQGKIWDSWISNRAKHMVVLRREFKRCDLDRISEADWDILDSVWKKFGKMNRWELCDYTHEHCAEWKNPEECGKSVMPINSVDIFIALGMEKHQAQTQAKEFQAQKYMMLNFV